MSDNNKEKIYDDKLHVSFVCDACGGFVFAQASNELQLVKCNNCGAKFLGEFNQWVEQVKGSL